MAMGFYLSDFFQNYEFSEKVAKSNSNSIILTSFNTLFFKLQWIQDGFGHSF